MMRAADEGQKKKKKKNKKKKEKKKKRAVERQTTGEVLTSAQRVLESWLRMCDLLAKRNVTRNREAALRPKMAQILSTREPRREMKKKKEKGENRKMNKGEKKKKLTKTKKKQKNKNDSQKGVLRRQTA